jgi:diguanylate cyclase
MTELNNPWRDKYRRSLAEQERLEGTVEAQKTMLLRAVLNLSAAADGKDVTLDERLDAIISSIKSNDVAGLDRMLKSLPRVTEEADKRQQEHWKEITGLMVAIASQTQKQTPSANLKSTINNFKKQLPKSSPSAMSAGVKKYLSQLSQIQQQAISQAPKLKTGLLGKLFNDKSASVAPESIIPEAVYAEDENTDDENHTPDSVPKLIIPVVGDENWEEVDESILGKELIHSGELLAKDPDINVDAGYQRERQIPESILREELGQQTSPEVPSRVSVILVELLDHFKTVPAAQQKAIKARKRIAQGLRWFELVPTLEDIRDFVLQAYIGADKEYQQYLEHLYKELSDILSALGVSIKTEEQIRLAANALQENVSEGVENITQALSENNTDALKQAVESHVHQLQLALTQFSKQTAPNDEGDSLRKQLHSLSRKIKELEQSEKTMRDKLKEETKRAMTDTLTDLPNREAYNERIHQEIQRWQRYGNPLTIAVVDIDFFKKINDNYGHQIGDKVLKIVAMTVAKLLREVDFMARYGGEEFVVLLPETDAGSALTLLNRIREDLAKKPLKYKEDKISLTVSIGISQFIENDTTETAFSRADEALYKAKESGRNQCIVH